jgi:hypothetical protein
MKKTSRGGGCSDLHPRVGEGYINRSPSRGCSDLHPGVREGSPSRGCPDLHPGGGGVILGGGRGSHALLLSPGLETNGGRGLIII